MDVSNPEFEPSDNSSPPDFELTPEHVVECPQYTDVNENLSTVKADKFDVTRSDPSMSNSADSVTSAMGSDSCRYSPSNSREKSKPIPQEATKRSVSFGHLLNPELRSATTSMRKIKNHLIGGKYTQHEIIFVTTAGVCLSFNSGYINGSCLSGLLTPAAIQQSVAGFTGSYTISALALADGEFNIFGRQLCMILSFIFGAAISGYMTPNATPYRLEPSYGPTFFLGGVFLLIASILAVFNFDDYLFYFAAAANGIQNGISSIYSANLIRSTHLTGTSTDIGIFIGQLLKGNRNNLWKLLVLIALATSFWLGSLISFYATTYFTHYSLLFNAGMFMLIGCAFVKFLMVELEVSFQAAVMGSWMWGKVFDELLRSDRFLNSKESLSTYFDNLEGTQDDGELDKDELLDALVEAGIKISKRQVEILLRAADTDGNGKIDKDEWMTIATSAAASSSKKNKK